MDSVIRVRNLSKLYRTANSKIYAVNDVSCDIFEGEFCAITGKSGCGKSTFLTLLAGIERATSGQIFIHNTPIHKFNEKQLVDFRYKNIGFVFQSFHLLKYLNVLENIAFPLMVGGVDKIERNRRAMELIERMELTKYADHMPEELSGGQQQRVSIARAIIGRPSILFADEPTGNLDKENSAQIMDLFHDINRQGTTIVMVTHDIGFAGKTDRIIELSDGQILSC